MYGWSLDSSILELRALSMEWHVLGLISSSQTDRVLAFLRLGELWAVPLIRGAGPGRSAPVLALKHRAMGIVW